MENEEMGKLNLPPGFRFDPTDEELVLHFLYPKLASLSSSHPDLIPQIDFCEFSDPWQLIVDGGAFHSYGQWYFYTKKTENRVTRNGYWIEVNMDQPIFDRISNKLVGLKKTLEFYMGQFPSGVKTGWLMQEYHMCNNVGGEIHHKSRRKQQLDVNKWILCQMKEICDNNNPSSEVELSFMDEVFLSLDDDHDEISFPY